MDSAVVKELVQKSKKLKLLYVEDDKISREAVLDFLGIFFDDITVASDGFEGLEAFKQGAFDVVITDINMPRMDGLELLKEIKNICEDTLVVIFSAFDDPHYFVRSIEYDVDGYLRKPFESQQFFSIISKIVKKFENEQQLKAYTQDLQRIVEEKTKEIEYRCLHEFYTDLPNSIMLQDDLISQEYNYMLILDISHFSVLNKEYGKEFANHVITRTARILEKNIHKNAKLYKVESDRFAILVKDATLKDIYLFCDQIVSFFDTKNIQVDDSELHVTFNIGVDEVRADVSETLINCEYALDKAKELGSRHYEIYKDHAVTFTNEKEAIKWLRLTRELILNEAIEPFFQPILCTKTGKVIKYEALARGRLDGEIVTPQYFIKPAEKLGLSSVITRLMVNKTFAFFKDRDDEFSINLTERDLLEGHLIKFLKEKINQYNMDPSRVTFEILENITVAKNAHRITKKLNRLREMGFKVAVDDFGIENSNFSRLLEIQLDFIKIDGLFIRNLKTNERNRTITRAIVNLAKTLGIQTVAEYVEDAEIQKIIVECGIDYAQGYHIGKPQPYLLS